MKQPANRCFFLRLTNALKQSPIFKFHHLKPPLIEKLRQGFLKRKFSDVFKTSKSVMKESFEVNTIVYQKIRQPVIGICLDGTSPEYLDKAVDYGYMPVAGRLKEKGWLGSARSVMPSYTNPNNIAIVTGTTPDKNGICGNYFYDAEHDREVMMNEPEFLLVPSIFEAAFQKGYRVAVVTAKDKLLKLLSKGWEGVAFSGERADQASIEGIGSVAEKLGEKPPHYSEAIINRYTMQAAYLTFRKVNPDIMYISLTDCVQHRAAPGEDEANVMLSEIDGIIGKFIDSGARIGITSDHGMNYKIKADKTPNVIYLGDLLSGIAPGPFRVVLPITDPYISHHSALGSFATIYCSGKQLEPIKNEIAAKSGISEVLERNEACRKYALPGDRIGDLIVIADKHTVLGKTAASHDLSLLKGPLRSHGGLAETAVPFGFSGPVKGGVTGKTPRNLELFDYLINRL